MVSSVEPMVLGTTLPRGDRFSWSLPGFLFLALGAACLVLWSGEYGQGLAVTGAPLTMSSHGVRLGGVQQARAMMPAHLSKYGIGATPLERAAIIALEASGQGSCGRSVSVKAEAKADIAKEVASMDGETKAAVEKVAEKVKLKAKDMAGNTLPLAFWDPFGFSADCDEGKLLFYREAELKHGRVCMLASLGILVAEQYHPLFGGTIDVPAYIAFQQTPLQEFWGAVLTVVGFAELGSIETFDPDERWQVKSGRVPGDLGFDPLNLKPSDPAKFRALQNKEINNGRLAMFAAAGMIAQELVTGKKIF